MSARLPNGPGRVSVLPFVFVAACSTVLRQPVLSLFAGPAARAWATIAISVMLQALPFLALGVLLGSAVAAFVSAEALVRALPRSARFGVPLAGLAGVALPGCECASVPVAGRLIARGVPVPAALAFLASAPAVNPVVVVATALAFPGRPSIVVGRVAASYLTALLIGFASPHLGVAPRCATPAVPTIGRRAGPRAVAGAVAAAFVEDFLPGGGFLVAGAAVTATLQVAVGPHALAWVGGRGPAGMLALGVLAVLLCVCSEADAFVAASLTQFSTTARLAFMVVGPVVDLKLIALDASVFGPRFALRYSALAFAVAMGAAGAAGLVVR